MQAIQKAGVYVIAPGEQLVIDDVFHKVILLDLPEAKPGVTKADVLEVVLLRRAYIGITFDVEALRLAHEVGVFEVLNVGCDRLVTDVLALHALENVHEACWVSE